MKKYQMILLSGLFLITGIAMKAHAQTAIPDTAEKRAARAAELEQLSDWDQRPDTLREMAMLHSVIAGLDQSSSDATEKALGILEKAEKSNPGDYELMAAHGSVLTMMARYQENTGQQLRYVKKGFRKMDRAIKKDPDNIGALIQRGSNALNTPPFLKRAHFARSDFQHILKLVGDSRGPKFKAMILFYLGEAHHLLKEETLAQRQWQAADDLNAGYWSDKARKKRM